jgi:hypothetical protein
MAVISREQPASQAIKSPSRARRRRLIDEAYDLCTNLIATNSIEYMTLTNFVLRVYRRYGHAASVMDEERMYIHICISKLMIAIDACDISGIDMLTRALITLIMAPRVKVYCERMRERTPMVTDLTSIIEDPAHDNATIEQAKVYMSAILAIERPWRRYMNAFLALANRPTDAPLMRIIADDRS